MVEEPLPEVSAHEIQKLQGTRLEETPPWMSYAAEMEEQLDSTLEAEIAHYAEHRHEKSSSQNEEELCRQRELNAGVAKEYQFVTPEEYAEIEPRIGRPLTHAQMIDKLRTECKVQCWYRNHPQPDKLTLVWSGYGVPEPQVACWVQNGWMPEYSIMRFDDHGVPLDERRRGWRTCLLQMVLKGIVSEETVTRVFGQAQGPASERYNAMLYEWRNRRIEIT